MRFFSIASGSSGNAYYLGAGNKHYLVDAGISCKRIFSALTKYGISHVDGIFVTHEHSDHTTGAGVVSRRFNSHIYASPKTWRYFLRHKTLGPIDESNIKTFEPDYTYAIETLGVCAFSVSHDASQPVGYSFVLGDKKISLATDLGVVTDTVRSALSNCDVVVLESNHDPEMLINGKYHKDLKARVKSNNGHLSNEQAAEVLVETVTADTHVFLAHLSEENNTPMLAYDTVSRILDDSNTAFKSLTVAERTIPGEIIEL